jgi:hypothetical protein
LLGLVGLAELGETSLTKMSIKLTDDIPVVYNPYRIPSGLSNAPSVFQRTINTMLKGSGRSLALAYMDDL